VSPTKGALSLLQPVRAVVEADLDSNGIPTTDGASLPSLVPPKGTGEAPRRPPVRGFSMRDVHSKQSSKMGEGSRGFLCDLW